MNKTYERLLKKDPRYQRIISAEAKLTSRLARAKAAYEAEEAEAKAEYAAEAPEMADAPSWLNFTGRAFEALRPRGDRVHITRWVATNPDKVSVELESFSEARIRIVGVEKPFVEHAFIAGKYRSGPFEIEETDLERIKRGEVKGWRQKPWGL